ncbi:MAG TPA: hypothetical protein VIE65_10955 [Methylobacter sp.]|jgi:hypothetical protein
MSLKTSQTGSSLFDFAVTSSIIVILAAILLFSLNRAQSQAEAVVMETDLTHMRWGLRELWAHRNAIGQSIGGSEIENTNPLRLLNERPKNYSGEFAETPPGAQATWYFDTKAKRLVYVFSDGQQARYRLASTAGLNRASLGAIGGMDLVLD